MHVGACVNVGVCMCACTCACVRACVCVCVCVCVYSPGISITATSPVRNIQDADILLLAAMASLFLPLQEPQQTCSHLPYEY